MCRRNFLYEGDNFEDPEDVDPSGEYIDYGIRADMGDEVLPEQKIHAHLR